MKLIEICLLKEGDKVYVNNSRETVKETAKNETIKVGNKYRYFDELSKTKIKDTGYANGIYEKLMVD